MQNESPPALTASDLRNSGSEYAFDVARTYLGRSADSYKFKLHKITRETFGPRIEADAVTAFFGVMTSTVKFAKPDEALKMTTISSSTSKGSPSPFFLAVQNAPNLLGFSLAIEDINVLTNTLVAACLNCPGLALHCKVILAKDKKLAGFDGESVSAKQLWSIIPQYLEVIEENTSHENTVLSRVHEVMVDTVSTGNAKSALALAEVKQAARTDTFLLQLLELCAEHTQESTAEALGEHAELEVELHVDPSNGDTVDQTARVEEHVESSTRNEIHYTCFDTPEDAKAHSSDLDHVYDRNPPSIERFLSILKRATHDSVTLKRVIHQAACGSRLNDRFSIQWFSNQLSMDNIQELRDYLTEAYSELSKSGGKFFGLKATEEELTQFKRDTESLLSRNEMSVRLIEEQNRIRAQQRAQTEDTKKQLSIDTWTTTALKAMNSLNDTLFQIYVVHAIDALSTTGISIPTGFETIIRTIRTNSINMICTGDEGARAALFAFFKMTDTYPALRSVTEINESERMKPFLEMQKSALKVITAGAAELKTDVPVIIQDSVPQQNRPSNNTFKNALFRVIRQYTDRLLMSKYDSHSIGRVIFSTGLLTDLLFVWYVGTQDKALGASITPITSPFVQPDPAIVSSLVAASPIQNMSEYTLLKAADWSDVKHPLLIVPETEADIDRHRKSGALYLPKHPSFTATTLLATLDALFLERFNRNLKLIKSKFWSGEDKYAWINPNTVRNLFPVPRRVEQCLSLPEHESVSIDSALEMFAYGSNNSLMLGIVDTLTHIVGKLDAGTDFTSLFQTPTDFVKCMASVTLLSTLAGRYHEQEHQWKYMISLRDVLDKDSVKLLIRQHDQLNAVNTTLQIAEEWKGILDDAMRIVQGIAGTRSHLFGDSNPTLIKNTPEKLYAVILYHCKERAIGPGINYWVTTTFPRLVFPGTGEDPSISNRATAALICDPTFVLIFTRVLQLILSMLDVNTAASTFDQTETNALLSSAILFQVLCKDDTGPTSPAPSLIEICTKLVQRVGALNAEEIKAQIVAELRRCNIWGNDQNIVLNATPIQRPRSRSSSGSRAGASASAGASAGAGARAGAGAGAGAGAHSRKRSSGDTATAERSTVLSSYILKNCGGAIEAFQHHHPVEEENIRILFPCLRARYSGTRTLSGSPEKNTDLIGYKTIVSLLSSGLFRASYTETMNYVITKGHPLSSWCSETNARTITLSAVLFHLLSTPGSTTASGDTTDLWRVCDNLLQPEVRYNIDIYRIAQATAQCLLFEGIYCPIALAGTLGTLLTSSPRLQEADKGGLQTVREILEEGEPAMTTISRAIARDILGSVAMFRSKNAAPHKLEWIEKVFPSLGMSVEINSSQTATKVKPRDFMPLLFDRNFRNCYMLSLHNVNELGSPSGLQRVFHNDDIIDILHSVVLFNLLTGDFIGGELKQLHDTTRKVIALISMGYRTKPVFAVIESELRAGAIRQSYDWNAKP